MGERNNIVAKFFRKHHNTHHGVAIARVGVALRAVAVNLLCLARLYYPQNADLRLSLGGVGPEINALKKSD